MLIIIYIINLFLSRVKIQKWNNRILFVNSNTVACMYSFVAKNQTVHLFEYLDRDRSD
jgi:hypothetical protein